MHAAAVFAKRFVTHPVDSVLDSPVTAIPVQQRQGIRPIASNTRDSIRHFGRRLTFSSGRADDLTDLFHARPVEVFVEQGG